MTKKLFITPETCLKNGKLDFPLINLCQERSFETKRQGLSDFQLLNILLDMNCIRFFENKLKKIKLSGEYHGQKIALSGPIHLINGEEAACVGQAYALSKEDYSFGSHRSHGEILARSLVCIQSMDDSSLLKIMQEYMNGVIFEIVKSSVSENLSIKQLARIFVYYGTMSEILGKSTGFQKGLGGSMHVFFPPFGIYPANAIVGASAPIAAGAALYKKINKNKSIAVANLGDGATGCGVVSEAMNFSAMKQFDVLWKTRGSLPILFAFFNNGYGMGGQTLGETMAYDCLSRIGAGISENAMNSERVNGMDPLAIYFATKEKKNLIMSGEGPAILDMVVYRYEGHSQSDKEEYRTNSEIFAWKKLDPLETYENTLLMKNIATKKEIQKVLKERESEIDLAFKMASEDRISPRSIFSRKFMENNDNNFISTGKENISKDLYEFNKDYTNKDALSSAIEKAFDRYPELISYGVNARDWGGQASVYWQASKKLPYERLFNTPVSEACMVSVAVGYAMCGGRAIVDLMFSGFIGRAGDEIFNQLAKWKDISGGYFNMPVIIRVVTSRTYGAQHSQDWASLVSHIPGLCVLYPVTPYDVEGLFNAALRSNKPVIFFESKELYGVKELYKNIPNVYYECEIGVPVLRRSGKDITILSVGPALYDAMDAAVFLEKEGVEVEIFDARSLVPFDYSQIISSVKKTGRLMVVGHENERASILTEFSHKISVECFKSLKTAPIVIGAANNITPSFENYGDFLPSSKYIILKARELVVRGI